MSSTNKEKKGNQSLLKEMLWGILDLFLGDITSKITWALLSLFIGILFLTRPVIDLNGKELEKGVIPYVIGSVLILLSVILIISWIRKRKANK